MLTVVGGVIPNRDVPVLQEIGVRGVFPGGTPFEEIIGFIRENASRN
jgi:methylmalonyl-CoA mutase C-terminal domain/subunit